MNTQKKIWPAYIPPQEDELLSSWLFRVSREHKIKPHSFTLFYFQNPNIWSRDIDKYISPEIIRLISEYTPLKIDQIKNLQLDSYRNILFEGDLNPAFTQGITNMGIYHRIRRQNGLLICPSCINKNPYYKKTWRLLSSIVCSECKSYLLDCCPNCAYPIIFQRLAIGDKSRYEELPVYLCWNCHYDFRETHKPIFKNQLALEYQSYINKTIAKGYNQHTQYSFLYFNVLFIMLRMAKTSSGLWNRIRNALIEEFNLNPNEIFERSLYSSLDFRIKILPLIYLLLKDWPTNFITFCNVHRIRYSDFSKDNADKIPFWFYRAFKESF